MSAPAKTDSPRNVRACDSSCQSSARLDSEARQDIPLVSCVAAKALLVGMYSPSPSVYGLLREKESAQRANYESLGEKLWRNLDCRAAKNKLTKAKKGEVSAVLLGFPPVDPSKTGEEQPIGHSAQIKIAQAGVNSRCVANAGLRT